MRKWKLGTIIGIDELIEKGADKIYDLGLDTCQVSLGDYKKCTPENLAIAKRHLKDFDQVSFWVGWPGECVWDFIEGPLTIGFLPDDLREIRKEAVKKEMLFAKQAGAEIAVTHYGFVPENPNLDSYKKMVECLEDLSNYAVEIGIEFCLETGQETPITLRRIIEDAGAENLGINLDTANLILYGKANPVDAVDMFGDYVRCMHIKDGEYPTNAKELGQEKAIGKGQVDFYNVFKKLAEHDFDGPLIIEREISGEQQIKDIKKSIKMIDDWMAAV